MSRDLSNLFKLVVPENLQQDAPLPSLSKVIAFDDLADFVAERERIRRRVEQSLESEPKVDYSDYSNHVFFDSALSKFTIAKNKILNTYPFAGNSEDKDLFTISSSFYEGYVQSQWPRNVGYLYLSNNQSVIVPDPEQILSPGSSSIYASARILPDPFFDGPAALIDTISKSAHGDTGYSLYLTPSDTSYNVNFYVANVVANQFRAIATSGEIPSYLTAGFVTVAGQYDAVNNTVSVYVNDMLVGSQMSAIRLGSIDSKTNWLSIGHSVFYSPPYNNFVGAIDEVRVLFTASSLYCENNFDRPIDSEDFVKAYFKFNEGIVGQPVYDSVVIDYSKSGLHGTIVNYTTSSRVSGSSMYQEPGDPILYANHPSVISYTGSQESDAQIFDAGNRNYILRLIPEDLLADDQNANGLLISFSLAMARYFDELKTYVDQFDNLKVTNYDNVNETPDLMLPLLKNYFGWKVTDHFGDANPLEFFFGENILTSGSLGTSLTDIRNQFWRRILNNLPYLYKTKGKRNNLDSFFNVLGINSDLLNIKEYGYLNSNTINDEFVLKEKPITFLGFGVYGNTGSCVQIDSFVSSSLSQWTMETVAQLPYLGMPYTSSLVEGSIWQMYSSASAISLLWDIPMVGASTGTLTLKDTNGNITTTVQLPVFDGQFIHIAAGYDALKPFIKIRKPDNGTIVFSSSVNNGITGSDRFSLFQSGGYGLRLGASTVAASGYYGQYRFWSGILSSSELDVHALNFDSVGTAVPLSSTILSAYWALNTAQPADANGQFVVTDLSRRGQTGVAKNFAPFLNSYSQFLLKYSSLSPSVDLKWTQNKIRIRNKTELKIADIANDTNQVSLEFNLVDSLDEDIVKIFSTLNTMNNAIGSPVNKYRDEYEDLESLRRIYFERLSDDIKFTNFFKLFRWFDKKLATSIKQLLPARVDFIGGEFVVQSHLLERNKYKYIYPLFHTPKDVGLADMGQLGTNTSGSAKQKYFDTENPMRGTYVETDAKIQFKRSANGLNLPPRPSSVVVDGKIEKSFVSRCVDGNERIDRNPSKFFKYKVSGDSTYDSLNSFDSSNYKNEYSRKIFDKNLQNNFDGYRSGTFIHPSLGNGFVMKPIQNDNTMAAHGTPRFISLSVRGLSGSSKSINSGSLFVLSGGSSIELSQTLCDANNLVLDTGSFINIAFGIDSNTAQLKYDASVTFSVSGTQNNFSASDISVLYKDNSTGSYWQNYRSITGLGSFIPSGKNDNWYSFYGKLDPVAPTIITFNGANTHFLLSCSFSMSYALKNFMVSFDQPLSVDGVDLYYNIDNQNNKKYKLLRSVNRNIMGNIEDGKLRQTPYYGWQRMPVMLNGVPAGGTTLKADLFGAIYILGAKAGIIKSTDFGGTWRQIYQGTPSFFAISPVNRDYLYSNETSIIKASYDGGNTWNVVFSSSLPGASLNGIAIDRQGSVYFAYNTSNLLTSSIYKSNNFGTSGTFSSIFTLSSSVVSGVGSNSIDCNPVTNVVYWSNAKDTYRSASPQGNINSTFVPMGFDGTFGYGGIPVYKFAKDGTTYNVFNQAPGGFITVQSSSIALTGSDFGLRSFSWLNDIGWSGDSFGSYVGFAADTNNYLYMGATGFVYTSPNLMGVYSGRGNTFYGKYLFGPSHLVSDYSQQNRTSYFLDVEADAYGNVYELHYLPNFSPSINIPCVVLSRGNLQANSSSLGAKSLATSVGYVKSENDTFISSSYRLNNVSEFPHYGGLFQMKNMILGTQDTGIVGKTDDSIVQVRYVGSVVNIMWPNQTLIASPVPGFGELSPGQSPGKLSTDFSFGSLVDTATYDQLGLYCYLQKQVSGTLDDIVIQIQRRPLKSVGFATDQTVDYSASGSYTEARYRDQFHTKQVDYGDLSLPTVSYVIDVPLTNVSQIRIGARLKNGQSVRNQNFLVWGRLIKTADET